MTLSEFAAPRGGARWLGMLYESPQPIRARSDLACFALVLASFAIGLAVSWERWGNPAVDSGRELNVPLRLLHGEMLYSDVGYLYGPLSPYLNALIYRIFHPSLWALWGHGIVATIAILALTYFLGRQIMGRFAAVLACLLVTWVCALKSQGNYMLAYSFGGLDGSLFVLATTAASVLGIRSKSLNGMLGAGLVAALAILSKTEMGAAALVIGVVGAVLIGYGRANAWAYGLTAFVIPAVGLAAIVFAWFAARVGWKTLMVTNHIFFGHVPWQLIYFNGFRFGFNRPWHSLGLMTASLIRLVAFGGLVASVVMLIERRRRALVSGEDDRRSRRQFVTVLTCSAVAIVLTTAVSSDLGPLIAMPFILLGLGAAAIMAFVQAKRNGAAAEQTNAGVVVILVMSALACLPRIVLRVSTGGAMTSFLLPGSIILFVYVFVVVFPIFIPEPRGREFTRRVMSGVLIVGLLATAGTVAVRYRRKFTCPWVTPRGTWVATSEQGIAFREALAFVEQKTHEGDAVAVLPEGTSLVFVSNRRNPLGDEIITPGFLDAAGEDRAIQDLRKSRAPLIFIANRATPEFAQVAFGKDYDQKLMSWIEQNYGACGIFGPNHDPTLQIGDPVFFLRAYCSSPSAIVEH